MTKLADGQNVSRLKAVNVNDKIFMIFEVWSRETYINTQYMIIDVNGKILTKSTIIPFKIKLHKSDDIYATDKSVIFYAGGKGKILNRYEVYGLN